MDNAISMESDKERNSTENQMSDSNCDSTQLDSTNDCDSDNSASESDRAKKNNTNEIEKEDLIALEENCKLRDLPYDTCLQNELPEEANQVFSIAPGEGNKPIPLLTDTLFEELVNSDKFPYGDCYIGIDLDLSKPKGMPLGLKLHTYSFTTKYIYKAKVRLWPEQVSTVYA